jgi:hypothetical protein
MEEVAISQLTPNHKRKIMRGEPIRIKKGGSVVKLFKHRLPQISKAFSKGKAHTITMTPEEIHANGTGIFGKSFDKFLDKHGVKKLAYKVGDTIKPIAKTALTAGILTGASALAGGETLASSGIGSILAPAILTGGAGLANLVNEYLDNPKKYQDTNANKEAKVALQDLKNAGMSKYGFAELGTNPYASLNEYTGNNSGALGTSNGQQAIANSLSQQLSNAQGFARESLYSAPVFTGGLNAPSILESVQLQNPLRVNSLIGTPTAPTTETPVNKDFYGNPIMGTGLKDIVKRHSQSHTLRGMGVKHRHGKLIEMGSIGIHGNLTRTPQALEQAPYASNFMWSSTLPPSYKRFNSTPAPPAPLF